MKSSATVYVGIFAGVVFVVAWWIPLPPNATFALTFVSGIAAVFAQLSTRDLLARIYNLMERGADESVLDGGELRDDSTAMRNRISSFTTQTMIAGVLAPALATLNTLLPHPFIVASAFGCAAFAFALSILLYSGNKQLGGLLIAERERRAAAKRQRDAIAERKEPDTVKLARDPNLNGYGIGETAQFPQ